MADFDLFDTYSHVRTTFALKEALKVYKKDPTAIEEEMIEYLCEPFLDKKEEFEIFYPEVN